MDCNQVRFYVEKFTYEYVVEELGRRAANEIFESYNACVEESASWFIVPTGDANYLVKTMRPDKLVGAYSEGNFNPELLEKRGIIDEYYDLGPGDWRRSVDCLVWSILQRYLVKDGTGSVDKHWGDVSVVMRFNVPASALVKVRKMRNPNVLH